MRHEAVTCSRVLGQCHVLHYKKQVVGYCVSSLSLVWYLSQVSSCAHWIAGLAFIGRVHHLATRGLRRSTVSVRLSL